MPKKAHIRQGSISNQRIRLTHLCAGQVFGEEDIVNNRKATTSAVCISTEAQVYCIKAEEFLTKLQHPNQEKTWNMILASVYHKDVTTKKKIKLTVYNYHNKEQSPSGIIENKRDS